MKKCPFCKADIEDNARFCLYCMKPLREKEVISQQKKAQLWWLLPVVVALLLLGLLVVLLTRGENPATPSQTASGSLPVLPQDSGAIEDLAPSDAPVQDPPVQSDIQSPADTTETEPEQQNPQATYTYRLALPKDDFYSNYTNAGNDIVITGIAQSAQDGVYDIPSYIDGKKVIAIVANAFSGSNAKTVYVPATVKTIWNYAFSDCSLQDIYFRGNAIYAESIAFDGNLTIHCSAACSDRNARYYKDSAANYGATWKEWNG